MSKRKVDVESKKAKNFKFENIAELITHYCEVAAKGKRGYTSLHLAVEKNKKEDVSLLLRSGFNVNAKAIDNITPLHIAAIKGYMSIAEDLLNHSGSLDSLTLKEGYTPLHFASELGHLKVAKIFSYSGAAVNVTSTKDKLTPLHVDIKKRHPGVVNLLLRNGAQVYVQDTNGITILSYAVECANLTIVKYILSYCPDVNNRNNRNALHIAVQRSEDNYDKEIVEALLDFGFTFDCETANNQQLLFYAVRKGNLGILQQLLKKEDNVDCPNNAIENNYYTPFQCGAEEEFKVIKRLFLNNNVAATKDYINALDKYGKTPIFYAIINVNLPITMLLLSNGANVKDNPKLLHLAVERGGVEIVEALLQHNADVNFCDEFGRSALHLSVLSSSKTKIIELLISKGAYVDAKTTKGGTALHYAALKGNEKAVEALLKYNPNVNSKTFNGITPLCLSVQKGNIEISNVLLNNGAKINSKLQHGYIALHLAALAGKIEILQLLLKPCCQSQ